MRYDTDVLVWYVADDVGVDSKSRRVQFRRHDAGYLETQRMFPPRLTASPVRHPREHVAGHDRTVYRPAIIPVTAK